MKKLCVILSLLLALPLAACAMGGPAPTEAPFTWARQGTFTNENNDFLSVTPSADAEHPGWYVLFMGGDGMHGWYLPQVGKTLHGDLAAPYLDGGPFVVTLSEEGEDGLLLVVENGPSYHFKPREIPAAAFSVSIGVEGDGAIAFAEGVESPVFDPLRPARSAYIGLDGPATYTFAAEPAEGWSFDRWIRNGSDYVREVQISIELDEKKELVAVFVPAERPEPEAAPDMLTAETGAELLDAGWTLVGWDADALRFTMEYEDEQYAVEFEETPDAPDTLTEEALRPLTVKSIERLPAETTE